MSLRLPRVAWVVLLLTAAIALSWSHAKLLSQDEIFVLQTDSVSSLGRLVEIQRTMPISLDPLVYHALAHGAMRVFGVGAFGLRLPSLLGYLLMQVGVFWFVRRWLGGSAMAERAGVVAMAVPALTATLFYAAEGRPYGVLLGMYAMVLVLWQSGVRRESGRVGVLVGLAVVIALTLNTHYFGVLLLVPLCGAEVWREVARRRVDWAMVVAIVVGMGGIVFTLPFQRAAGEFRLHYYNGGTVGLRTVSQAYRSLFVDYTGLGLGAQRGIAVVFVVVAMAFVVACVVRLRGVDLPSAEVVFVVLLAGLPVFGFLLARFVTHAMEVRYVLGAVIGVAALVGIVAAPWLRSVLGYGVVMAGLVAVIVMAGAVRVRGEHAKSARILASLVPSAALKAAMVASPRQRIYFQDMGHFDVASYYEPDVWVRERMALVESREEELRWDGHDTVSLTAEHMRGFTGFVIVPYAAFKALPGEKVMVVFHSGWDWTDGALREDGAGVRPVGDFMGGDAVVVDFSRSE